MKELWSILMEKLRQVEALEAAIGIGICSFFTIGMVTVIIVQFFKMITGIVLAFSGKPPVA